MNNRSTFREFSGWLVGTLCLALLVRTWLVMGLVVPVEVAGHSMQPILTEKKQVLVDRTVYLLQAPQRWDVIVFRCPEEADQLCIKRIVGLPGERIELTSGALVIDGTVLVADFGYEVRHEDRAAFQSRVNDSKKNVFWQLGSAEYFVLGDNGSESNDSRSWWHGPGLRRELIVGKALGVR